ncbi:MAG: hypothetical protein Tsb009_08400 [Planctomycetaceae bacterium]
MNDKMIRPSSKALTSIMADLSAVFHREPENSFAGGIEFFSPGDETGNMRSNVFRVRNHDPDFG